MPSDGDTTNDSTDNTDSDGGGGLAAAAADLLDRLGFDDLTADYRERNERGDERLAAAFDPLPDALDGVPAVSEVNKVNTHRDDDDVLVPVVPVVFADPGEPDADTVWTVVGTVLEAVHPVFEDLHVRHYDLQFAYADEAEETVIYRRVTVTPAMAARLTGEPGYGVDALLTAVREGDDGDDGVPPVYWQRFDAESVGAGSYGGGGAAVAAAAAASAGAAAACAGGAAAGAGAGAGGC
jgi:hypothetical protein